MSKKNFLTVAKLRFDIRRNIAKYPVWVLDILIDECIIQKEKLNKKGDK